MQAGNQRQEEASSQVYATAGDTRWAFHYTDDRLIRYLRDRRLKIAMRTLDQLGHLRPGTQSVLVVCGGVGGEGTWLRRSGFLDVTVSDFSEEALQRCQRFDPLLKTLALNAEDINLPNDCYDIVLVQDGLHHLSRPTLGFTEMLRVARTATVVIEPHAGLVGKLIGAKWEVHGEAVNYVFRWNALLLEQCASSYLLSPPGLIIVAARFWDHNVSVRRAVEHLPRWSRTMAARLVYGLLTPFNRFGNMMVGIVIKSPDSTYTERG